MTDKPDGGAPPSPEVIGPWRRKSAREVYENPWLRITHEEVITPAGTDGIYGVVHFKHRAIGIVPVDEQGHTWLVRQFRYTLGQPLWEIPMGGGKLHDDPLLAAQRELAEETGLRAANWREILRVHVSKSVTDEEGIVYLATGLHAGECALEHSEADLEVLRLPLREAIAWAMAGRITDVISCAALLKVALLELDELRG